MISILMTIYKEPFEWVEKAINSIANQTIDANLELVLVVDNPNYLAFDEVRKLVELKFDNSKIIVNKVNQGLVSSLNTAFHNSKGKYIARMDCDDISYQDRFKNELNFLKQNKLDFVASTIVLMSENETNIKDLSFSGYLLNEKLIKIQKKQNQFWHPTWFMKREVMSSLSGYRALPSVEDYDFVLRALLKGFKLGLLGNATVKKRFNKSSISETNNYKQTVYSDFLAKNFQNGQVADLSQLPSIDSSKEADFYHVKEMFSNRNNLALRDKVKLVNQLFLNSEGRRILGATIRQRYQVKVLLKMKAIEKLLK